VLVSVNYGSGWVATGVLNGQASVVVQNHSPFGAGWGIAGVDKLVGVSGGVLWVGGDGSSAFYGLPASTNADGSLTYKSPANDFGTLVESDDGVFNYTATDGTVETFVRASTSDPDTGNAPVFLLTRIVDPAGMVSAFSYDGDGRLVQITNPDRHRPEHRVRHGRHHHDDAGRRCARPRPF
jgi:YD repeat-containing protein